MDVAGRGLKKRVSRWAMPETEGWWAREFCGGGGG